MICFPNAKINLGLKVLQKRGDGYHDLETVFFPIPLYDILEIVKDVDLNRLTEEIGLKSVKPERIKLDDQKFISISFSGDVIVGRPEDNLCVKACKIFNERFEIEGNIALHLHKVIPSGAGLGGGSADAAFTLKMLNNIFGKPASTMALHEMAVSLGSDCAFFLLNHPSFATGKGEQLSTIHLTLTGYHLVLVKPPVHVSTAEAFANIVIDKNYSPGDIKNNIDLPLEKWNDLLVNDFQTPISKKHPEISFIKNILDKEGAIYASMTGSGSAVFGLFDKPVHLKNNFKDSAVYQMQL